MAPQTRTEIIRPYAPYVFLTKGETTTTYKLFLLIPVYEGESVTLISGPEYNSQMVTDLKYKIDGSRISENKIFIPKMIPLTPALPPPVGYGDDFNESFKIDIHVDKKDYFTKLVYEDRENRPIDIIGNIAINAPYGYLTEKDPDNHPGKMYPFLIIPVTEFAADPQTPIPANSGPIVIHQIELNDQGTNNLIYLYQNLEINSSTYVDNTSDLGGWLEVETEDPEDDKIITGGKKKRVKIRNKNSDNKPWKFLKVDQKK